MPNMQEISTDPLGMSWNESHEKVRFRHISLIPRGEKRSHKCFILDIACFRSFFFRHLWMSSRLDCAEGENGQKKKSRNDSNQHEQKWIFRESMICGS